MTRSARHRVEYIIALGVRRVVRLLPNRAALAIGAAIGLVVYGLDRRHRQVAKLNLLAAFPARTARERRRISRSVFIHLGRLLMGFLKFGTMSRDQMRALIDVEGEDRIRQALGKGKGVLILAGHFGFWEMHALGHSLLIGPMSVMVRPLDNPFLNDLLERARGATGTTVIHRRGGLRRAMRALAANHSVGFLIDQHIHGPDAVYVDFFERPAATTSALAALALRTGAPVIPVFTLPLPGGRYRLVYESPVEPPEPDDPDANRVFMQRCTDVLEMYVRRYPELWLWMHRRWREPAPSPSEVQAGASADSREART